MSTEHRSGADAAIVPKSRKGNGSSVRSPLDGARTRDREVIETAIRLFSEKGYASTSVQDLADAMGMLKGSLYYYIDTKETLLRKIFEDSHDEVREIAERHRASEELPVDRLSGFLEEYALWYLTHLARASLFSREWRHASDDLRALMAKQRKYYDDVLHALLNDAVDSGEISSQVDPKLATYYVMSAISSLPDWFSPSGPRSAADVAHDYARMSLRMLGQP